MQLEVIQLVLVPLPLRVTLVQDNNLHLDSKKWYILDKGSAYTYKPNTSTGVEYLTLKYMFKRVIRYTLYVTYAVGELFESQPSMVYSFICTIL